MAISHVQSRGIIIPFLAAENLLPVFMFLDTDAVAFFFSFFFFWSEYCRRVYRVFWMNRYGRLAAIPPSMGGIAGKLWI
jgi:hypothetical protein